MIKPSDEVIQALNESHGDPLFVETPGIDRQYLIVEAEAHAAVEAAMKQKTHASIIKGIEELGAGFGKASEQAFQDVGRSLKNRIGPRP